jgi:glycosyltransferase involved in cell wall biosynthesis
LNASSLKDIKIFIKLRKELKLYDLVIAELIWAQYWSGFIGLFDKSIRQKIMWVEHNVYKNRTRWQWLMLRILGNFVDKIIAVSDEVSLSFSQKTNLRTEVIYNAIVVPKNCHPNFSIGNRESIGIALYGRLVPQKNPTLAINAFLNLTKENNLLVKYKLEIIGGGSLEAKLIRNFSTQENIKFLGHKDKDQALSELSKNQIYLSTSIYEGFPLARFEALKLGLCVVSTRTAGYKFLLDYYKTDAQMRKIGIYFVDDSLKEIVNALKTLSNGNFWNTEVINQRIACTDSLSPKIVAEKFLLNLEV